ncbi:MAG: hypothetical protein ACREHD_10765 [Pirellulales bacterium]
MGRALHLATKIGRVLEEELGFGVHGMVWSTDLKSVIKVHGSERLYYERERDIYLRLQENGVTEVLGFHVPRMFTFDDELLALEIAIVQPPFVIDFAGAYLDESPDFSPEVWAEWEAEARAVRRALEQRESGRRGLSPLGHPSERRVAEQHSLRLSGFRILANASLRSIMG